MSFRRLGAALFEISLLGRSRALFFLLIVGCAAFFLAAEILLVGTASSFTTPSVARRILVVDRDDPRLEYRLGQIYQYIDPAEAVRHFRRATQLSPFSRRYWSHLASVCESLGDNECADKAWVFLTKLCPMVPLYHWHAAQSYLRTNQVEESLAQIRRLVDLDPTYAPDAWDSLRAVLGPDVIFQKLLADRSDPEIKVEYVDFLSGQSDHDAAYRIWRSVVSNSRPFSFSSARPYLERLISLGRIGEAKAVWQDLEGLDIVRVPAPVESDNLIFNGDFEQVPLNAGFDWHWSDRMTYLAVDFSAPAAYHGAHCLRIDFTVNRNDEYEPVSQIVAVLPSHRYRLEAYVRSEDITSDTGPSLRVTDTQQPSFPDAISETTVGTTPWNPVRLDFSTGTETQAVRLSIWRPRGRNFPTEISGTFWLDAVSLKDTGPAAQESAAGGQH